MPNTECKVPDCAECMLEREQPIRPLYVPPSKRWDWDQQASWAGPRRRDWVRLGILVGSVALAILGVWTFSFYLPR